MENRAHNIAKGVRKMKIKYYIELAKKKNNLTSDAQLAKLMKVSANTICHIANKKVYPKQENLIKILDLACIGDEERQYVMLDYVSSYRPKSEFSKVLRAQMKELPFYKNKCKNKT